MSEVATDITSEETTSVSQVADVPVADTPVSMVNSDGTFVDGWTDSLDEDIRNNAMLKTIPNVAGLAKSLMHAHKQVGKDMMSKPNEQSPEEDWNAAFDAMGRPATPGDYNFKRPDDIPEEHYNEDFAKAAQELMHKEGFSKKQAQAIFDFNNTAVAALIKQQGMDNDEVIANADAKLNEAFGNAKPQKLHLAGIAFEKAVGDNAELRERSGQKFGNDPDFLQIMASLGSKFAESRAITDTLVPTPTDYKEQLDEIMNSPAFMGGPDITDTAHQAAVQKAFRLQETMVKSVG